MVLLPVSIDADARNSHFRRGKIPAKMATMQYVKASS